MGLPGALRETLVLTMAFTRSWFPSPFSEPHKTNIRWLLTGMLVSALALCVFLAAQQAGRNLVDPSPLSLPCISITNQTAIIPELTAQTHYVSSVTHVTAAHHGKRDCILCIVNQKTHVPQCMGNPVVKKRTGKLKRQSVRAPHTCKDDVQVHMYDGVELEYIKISPQGEVLGLTTTSMSSDRTSAVTQLGLATLAGALNCTEWVRDPPQHIVSEREL